MSSGKWNSFSLHRILIRELKITEMKDPKPLALCLALGFVLSGCQWSKDARQIKGELQACESNIKNIGVAMTIQEYRVCQD